MSGFYPHKACANAVDLYLRARSLSVFERRKLLAMLLSVEHGLEAGRRYAVGTKSLAGLVPGMDDAGFDDVEHVVLSDS